MRLDHPRPAMDALLADKVLALEEVTGLLA
jgi:hypothetical protein